MRVISLLHARAYLPGFDHKVVAATLYRGRSLRLGACLLRAHQADPFLSFSAARYLGGEPLHDICSNHFHLLKPMSRTYLEQWT
mgnify:CR=1 FL=1